jgi:site-specific recombinase XerD
MTVQGERTAPVFGTASSAQWSCVRERFPARPVAAVWPATCQSRSEVWEHLTSAPFVLDNVASQRVRLRGLTLLLDWLAEQPGDSWQARWQISGADEAGAQWSQLSGDWLRERGGNPWRQGELSAGLTVAIGADVLRPSLSWLTAHKGSKASLVKVMAAGRDVEGFAQLRSCCGQAGASNAATAHTLSRCAVIVAAKGGGLRDLTVGDVLELLDVEADVHDVRLGETAVFYAALHRSGNLDPAAPATLRELRTSTRRTPDDLIDRYRLRCGPVRDLLVDYLREREPALDYVSLVALSRSLAKDFWADLEHHYPGINTLDLPADVAEQWKRRARTKPKTVIGPDGTSTQVRVERVNYRERLTRVRAFYLDLAQWAAEDPDRWGPWAVRCPISSEEVNQRKTVRHRKSRMDARTRERLPVLPILVETVSRRREDSRSLLQAAEHTPPGQPFTAAETTLVRIATLHAKSEKVWAADPVTGIRRDLTLEEDHAFWAWAVVETLRTTGVRIEELLETSHHSLVQYRLPTTGELVPLLQIAPSKTDAERLLVVAPDLADVLSTIINRLREPSGSIPLVPAYDDAEHLWLAPAPMLFQRRFGAENRRISGATVRKLLGAALADSGLTDPLDGSSLRYTPHDFRRIFITDAIMNGLPPHIAQIIAGHRDINVTLGYKAVYPDEAIQAHLAFLARRRALRPSEEYRTPTDEEWTEFLGHFERRKVSLGACGRAFGTPCIHEHACVRCSMLWPDPAQRPRLVEIRDNLTARISEAEREGWLGEIEGLQISLAGAQTKLAQIDRRTSERTTVDLGMPAINTSR